MDESKNIRFIIIDDFDKMLEALPNEEQYRLRAFLFKKNAPMLIATSTGLYEGFYHVCNVPFALRWLKMT